MTAVIVSMMSVVGAGSYFLFDYLFSCIFFSAGVYSEMRYRDCHPSKDKRFFLMTAVSVFPVLGPLIIFIMLYKIPRKGELADKGFTGFLKAILQLKANLLVVFLLFILLFFIFAIINIRSDPYFIR